MKITRYCFAMCLFICFSLKAQRNNTWCFGDSAGISFNNGAPVPIITSLDSRGSCVSISDLNGNLLFYAETRATLAGNTGLVFNKNNVLMQNGDSILGQGWYHEIIIIPNPANDSSFYLFSIGVTNSSLPGLFYSEIKFSTADSVGIVIQKNIQLLNFKMTDCLTAIKHGNGRDWWIICRESTYPQLLGNNSWYLYLVSPVGLINYGVQNVGNLNSTNSGRVCFTNDGNKLCFVSLLGMVELYDFDRCTGIISNANNIEQQVFGSYPYYWSCAFSPSGQYLYVTASTTPSSLWQFDIWAPNIPASKTLIWQVSSPPYTAGALKLAPDNKIYLSCAWSDSIGNFNYPYPDSAHYLENENLGVINSPDSLGLACNFQPWSFYLGGKRTYWGLPNNPDYELGPVTGSICDSLSTAIHENIPLIKAEVFAYYHKDWQTVFINAKGLKGKRYSLFLFDILGNKIYSSEGNLSSEYFTKDLHVQNFSKGMYMILLQTDKEKLVKKFIKD